MAYLSGCIVVASIGNMLLQYINSNLCIVRFEFGEKGGLAISGAPRMYTISNLKHVGQLHLTR
jgi:hypothetical protein